MVTVGLQSFQTSLIISQLGIKIKPFFAFVNNNDLKLLPTPTTKNNGLKKRGVWGLPEPTEVIFLWYIPGLWTCFEFYSVRSSFCPFDGLVGARRYFSSFFHYFKQLCLFEKLKEPERGVGGSVCVSMWVSLCANSRAHPALQKKSKTHMDLKQMSSEY